MYQTALRNDTCITQSGDLLQLDNHRILCGDATTEADILELLAGEIPNLMVTEPPYEVNYSQSWKQKIASSHFPNNEFLSASIRLFPGNICYIWHSSLESAKVEKSLRNFGFEYKSQIIWAKTEYELTAGDFHWHHEPCIYAVKKGHPPIWNGSENESTLWTIPNIDLCHQKDDMRTFHSGQKPVECMARPIRFSSNLGDAVYEPFCGSGSTLIACEILGRRCLGVEIFPTYCDEIVKRWIVFRNRSGKPSTVLKNGKETEEYYRSLE